MPPWTPPNNLRWVVMRLVTHAGMGWSPIGFMTSMINCSPMHSASVVAEKSGRMQVVFVPAAGLSIPTAAQMSVLAHQVPHPMPDSVPEAVFLIRRVQGLVMEQQRRAKLKHPGTLPGHSSTSRYRIPSREQSAGMTTVTRLPSDGPDGSR